MKGYIEYRAKEVGEYVIEKHTTVRQTARKFGVSKSTIHKDIVDRLGEVNPELAKKAMEVLGINKMERHIRGGEATRAKYLRG